MTATDVFSEFPVTSDALVALLYGALAYPSLRPGVSTTVDLVAGQPGPWTLPDRPRAALAMEMVDRLRTAAPASAVVDPLPTGLARARAELVGLVERHGRVLPEWIRHDTEVLEDKLGALVDDLADTCSAEPAPAGPVDVLRWSVAAMRRVMAAPQLEELAGSGVLELLLGFDMRAEELLSALDTATARAAAVSRPDPTVVPEPPAGPQLDRMVEWRRDELLAHLVGLDLDPKAALRHLRALADQAGRPGPRTWAEVVGRRHAIVDLLQWIDGELSGPTAAPDGSGVPR